MHGSLRPLFGAALLWILAGALPAPAAKPETTVAIREVTTESAPPVATFKHPVEFLVNVDDAPEMKPWAEKAARVCERQYAMINEELKSDGFKPPQLVTMTLKSDYNG